MNNEDILELAAHITRTSEFDVRYKLYLCLEDKLATPKPQIGEIWLVKTPEDKHLTTRPISRINNVYVTFSSTNYTKFASYLLEDITFVEKICGKNTTINTEVKTCYV